MRQRVARLVASTWASSTRAAAPSSRVQPRRGRSCWAVWLLASVTAATLTCGGRSPGAAGAWGVLEAVQSAGGEAFTPQADGVSVAVEFGGGGLVGGLIGVGGAED